MKSTKKALRIAAAGLLAGAVMLGGCSTSSPKPTPSDSPSIRKDPFEAAKAGAAWLKGHIVEDSYLEGEVIEKDVGLTIDALFAFAAAQDWDTANSLAAWVSQPGAIDDYASDAPTMSYPGAIAKMGLALTLEQIKYPEDIAASRQTVATRLVARLQEDGRFVDDSAYADSSNPIGQSFAIIFLIKVEQLGELSADPVDYLVSQACEDGSFPDQFDPPGGCVGSVDATAYAIEALSAVDNPAHFSVVTKAADWLVAQQDDQGRWSSIMGDTSVNSTAQAVLALGSVRSGPTNTAVANGWTALATWQLENGAFPVGGDFSPKAEPDVRATNAGVVGTAQADLAKLVGLARP
ncbi:MAG: terpene cyclase/mutase family protein [Micrococcales bacterium]|nr:terpene cyclase/mutase family protein [Micrococcales bacterium]